MAETKQDLPETPEEEIEESPKTEEVTETDKEALEAFLEEPLDKPEEPEEEPAEEPKEEPEEPVEEVKEEPVEEAPEVPVEEIAKEVRKDEREKVKEEILEAIGVSKEEKDKAEETGFKFAWEDRGEDRPASWKENAEETVRFYRHLDTQEKEVQAKEREEMSKVEAKREAEINIEWDAQVEYLVEAGEIPAPAPELAQRIKEGKVLTKAEREGDAGLKAQAEIFTKMYEMDQIAIAQGKRGVTNAVQFYHQHVKPTKGKKPAGAKAPVSGGRTPISTGKDEMTYEELHASEFEDIIEQG